MKNFWRLFLVVIVLVLFLLPSSVHALVCTSPKKGSVGGSLLVGTANFSYSYTPYSWSLQRTPMVNRGSIIELRRIPNPDDVCSAPYAGCAKDYKTETNCCPAKMIKKTIQARGRGGYWLIFNEPMGIDDYTSDFGKASGRQAADDAAFAISYIKARDPTAKFIVGWLYYGKWYNADPNNPCHLGCETSIFSEWPNQAPKYGLSSNMNDEIAGWSVHYITAATIAAASPAWPLRLISPGKEIWVTEFGSPLGPPDFPHCYYTYLNDPDSAAKCITYMQNLVKEMEESSYVTKYFWWSFASCHQPYNMSDTYPGCWAPLFNVDTNSLNELGKAFAAIPNDNGVCRYGLSPTPTPTLTPTPTATATPQPTTSPSPRPTPTPTPFPCPQGYKGDLNCNAKINETDLTILLSSWGPAPSPQPGHWSADLNNSETVDITDLNILRGYWGTI